MSTMPMPGQTWLPAAASFLGMWIVMMVAMMLPSLVPTLWRYRQSGLGQLTTLVGVGYFVVWTVFGMAAYPLVAALPSTTPIAVGAMSCWQAPYSSPRGRSVTSPAAGRPGA